MIWSGYLRWAKLDVGHYGSLPLSVRLAVFRHTLPTAVAFHLGRPARKWIRQRMPAWILFRLLECVGTRQDGFGWYRAPDRGSAGYLADVQPDRNREGQAILRQGGLMLLDKRGHISGFVIAGDNESVIELVS